MADAAQGVPGELYGREVDPVARGLKQPGRRLAGGERDHGIARPMGRLDPDGGAGARERDARRERAGHGDHVVDAAGRRQPPGEVGALAVAEDDPLRDRALGRDRVDRREHTGGGLGDLLEEDRGGVLVARGEPLEAAPAHKAAAEQDDALSSAA